jgi:hypothetical protein
MLACCTYLYGVVRSGASVPAGLAAIDPSASVVAIRCGELEALASRIPRGGFESEQSTDPAWVIPRALAHERLIERMAMQGPILPVRFGSLFSTDQALSEWVARNGQAMIRYLAHVVGKEEWTIKIELAADTAFESLIAVDPVWAEKNRLLPVSPGARYFREKRLRQDARLHVRQQAHEVIDKFRTQARAIAEERVLVPIEPIASLAYLVPREMAPTLLDQVRQAERDAACLTLHRSGPWAAAHFSPALEPTADGASCNESDDTSSSHAI